MAGPYDLTGQNIENTYQRVIQTPDGTTFYDGTGSLVTISGFPYTGSAFITGSLIVTGSVISTDGFTGSLEGSASYALTASYALSGGSVNTVKHDYSDPYDYLGVAASGTLESSPAWNITRLTIYLNGTSLSQTATGSWDDRAILIYT